MNTIKKVSLVVLLTTLILGDIALADPTINRPKAALIVKNRYAIYRKGIRSTNLPVGKLASGIIESALRNFSKSARVHCDEMAIEYAARTLAPVKVPYQKDYIFRQNSLQFSPVLVNVKDWTDVVGNDVIYHRTWSYQCNGLWIDTNPGRFN